MQNKFNFEEIFGEYIKQIVELTYGFTPEVKIELPSPEKVAIILDGSEMERCKMMGKDAANLKAMKTLLRALANRYNVFVYLYIAPYSFETFYEAHTVEVKE